MKPPSWPAGAKPKALISMLPHQVRINHAIQVSVTEIDDAQVEIAMLLADLHLSYPEFDSLDGAVEVVFRRDGFSLLPTAWPLLHESRAFHSAPMESASGGRTVCVPPVGVETRRGVHERMELRHNEWWSGLRCDFFTATRRPPPAQELFAEGSVRVFVLPIDGEVNQRRVVMSAKNAARLTRLPTVAVNVPEMHWLPAVAAAAAATPPIGEWPTSLSAMPHACGDATSDNDASMSSDVSDLYPHQRRTVDWMRKREEAPPPTLPLPALYLPGAPTPHELGDKPPAPPTSPDKPIVAPSQQARNATSPASTVAAGHSTTPDAIDVVGCAAPVKNIGRDSWGLRCRHNSDSSQLRVAWENDADGDTLCTIDYFIGKHQFSSNTVAAYTVSYNGDPGNCAMRADFIMRHLEPAKRASLRKQPGPRTVSG